MLDDFISCPRYKYTHQRTDEVEEAVGQIGQCGYTENGGLCHAAGIPRDKYGSDGYGIFGRTAQ